jgi:PleD family two-component response regulator
MGAMRMTSGITARSLRRIHDSSAGENRLTRLGAHDSLTGLPNRRFLEQYLDEAVEAAVAPDDQVAVLLLGLDRFRDINDSFGDVVGDGVLREVATLLLRTVGGLGTVGAVRVTNLRLFCGVRMPPAQRAERKHSSGSFRRRSK